MKQPPRTLLLVAALLALFFVPAPGLEPASGGPPVQGPFALASDFEDVELSLAGSYPTVTARRTAGGAALPPAALVVLPMLLAVAAMLLVVSGPAPRAAELAKLRGPPAG